jgi:hypothetical protein
VLGRQPHGSQQPPGFAHDRSSQWPWSSQTMRVSFTGTMWQTQRVPWRVSVYGTCTVYCCCTSFQTGLQTVHCSTRVRVSGTITVHCRCTEWISGTTW